MMEEKKFSFTVNRGDSYDSIILKESELEGKHLDLLAGEFLENFKRLPFHSQTKVLKSLFPKQDGVPNDVLTAQRYIAACHADMGFMGSPEYDRQKKIVDDYFEPIKLKELEDKEKSLFLNLKEKYGVKEQTIGWRIRHIPTGFFYQPHKHRGNNLSKLGKVYRLESHAKSAFPKSGARAIYLQEGGVVHRATKDIVNYVSGGYKEVRLFTKAEDWEIVKIN